MDLVIQKGVNQKMTENELRAAYLRQWRKNNKEKTRMYNRNYWAKKLAQLEAAEKEGKTDAMAEDKTRN